MEKNNLYHLDIKPRNILFDERSKKFLISDLNGSKFHSKTKTFILKASNLNYVSPELINT